MDVVSVRPSVRLKGPRPRFLAPLSRGGPGGRPGSPLTPHSLPTPLPHHSLTTPLTTLKTNLLSC